jgi:hypothetical protein
MKRPKEKFIEICRKYCQYFREGVKEGEACEGLKMLARIFNTADNFPFLTEHEKSSLLKKHDHLLEKHVCANCDWRTDDCDYRSLCPPTNTMPCGGLIYLALLIEEGIIDEEKLARPIN